MADEPRDPARSEISRRKFLEYGGLLTGAAALGSSALLAACTGNGATATTMAPTMAPTTTLQAGGPKRGGVLRAGIQGGSSADTLDSIRLTSFPDAARRWQLYDNVLERGHDFQVENVLAEEFAIESDPSTWVMRLRRGVEFHHGKTLTADDVIFSLQRIMDPENPGTSGPGLTAMMDPSGIEKVDEYTIRFNLHFPTVALPGQLAEFSVITVPVDFDPQNPVGTGAFKFDSFTPGQQSVFVRNENYWREGEPYLDEVVIIDFPDPTARLNALLSGVVDAIDGLPPAQIANVEAGDNLVVLESETGTWLPLIMRSDIEPFNDERVRQAFRLIVDRQEMVDVALGGHGRIANDLPCPTDRCYADDLPQREQDLEQAKFLLSQAGQEGLTIELTTSTWVAGLVETAQIFAEQAKGAGVNVMVNNVTPEVFAGENYKQWTFTQDLWPTKDLLQQIPAGFLPTSTFWLDHWTDERFASLYEEALREGDDDKRCDILHEAQVILYETGGQIIPYFTNNIDAHTTKLQGLTTDVSQNLGGYRFRSFWYE